jgi:2-dehydropantoate 2-reductase
MKVAILGAGSLGTISGALITKNGGDVVLIDANKEHVEALNKNGATITGKMDITVPVKAITPDAMSGEYDLVLYLVKQTYNEAALKALVPHLHKDSIVCTLQNGVPEDAVAAHVGREKVMGCAVGWGATWLRPGVSELTSESEKMTLDVGETGRNDQRADQGRGGGSGEDLPHGDHDEPAGHPVVETPHQRHPERHVRRPRLHVRRGSRQ